MTQELDHIGPYQILGLLAKGGMAHVYKALQPSTNRVVALKALRRELTADPMSIKRFTREAEVAARLAHGNIARVWDASLESPPYYIAMQLLEGGSLEERLQSGPLPVNEAVSILVAICLGLDHAHSRGIIHGNVKPENIMFDRYGNPILIGFGSVSDHRRLAATSADFGAPGYMSPEQAQGKEIDGRSDLYSTSVLMYEMLVGRTYQNRDALEAVEQIANGLSPAPAAPGVMLSPAVATALMRGLAKNPADRYHTGAELAWAFRVASNPEPAVVPELSAAVPDPPTAKNRAVTAGAWAVVIALVAVLLWQLASQSQPKVHQTPDAARRATDPFRTAAAPSASPVLGRTVHVKPQPPPRRSSVSVPRLRLASEKVANHPPAGNKLRRTVFATSGARRSRVSSSRYACPSCGCVFNSMGILRRHIAAAHAKQGFHTAKCSRCRAVFVSERALNRHLADSHRYKRRCILCGAGFTLKQELRQHSRLAHETGSPRKTLRPTLLTNAEPGLATGATTHQP